MNQNIVEDCIACNFVLLPSKFQYEGNPVVGVTFGSILIFAAPGATRSPNKGPPPMIRCNQNYSIIPRSCFFHDAAQFSQCAINELEVINVAAFNISLKVILSPAVDIRCMRYGPVYQYQSKVR